jgi:AcrR family transcriptional regulator
MSFIEEKRRQQIIACTIEVVAQRGLINTSFNKIAERASITAGLITYHFQTKQQLLGATLDFIQKQRLKSIEHALADAHGLSWAGKAELLISAELGYFGHHPNDWRALSEVVLGSRNTAGQLAFSGVTNDPAQDHLRKILQEGGLSLRDAESATFVMYSAYTNYLSLHHVTTMTTDQLLAELKRYLQVLIKKESA